ncbi:MAG: hypothetical protein EB084_04235 [Proteobacteria bacterium]|nr:hypothetical protein [Pseudomonadota bacterium]
MLSPGFTFRDANGDVRPGSFEVREVGQDPELRKDPGDRERRTALGVKFETPGGQTATAFSAHLSTESISAKRAEKLGQHHSKEEIATWKAQLPGQLAKVQRGEMQALEQFAHAFGGDGNVVIGADMNMTEPFKALPDFYDKESFGTTTALDHIFTSRDVTVGGHHWVRPGGPNSDLYSDHAMSVVDVLL